MRQRSNHGAPDALRYAETSTVTTGSAARDARNEREARKAVPMHFAVHKTRHRNYWERGRPARNEREARTRFLFALTAVMRIVRELN